MRHLSIWAPALLALAMNAGAQSFGGGRYEIGAGVVGSFYDKKTLTAASGNVAAGFDNGFGASVWLGHHMYPKVSGEIRYDLLRNDAMLDGSGVKATFGGESHSVHYDLHFHFNSRENKVRPFAIVGAGVRMFRGTGAERAFQPLSQAAVLTRTTETAGLLTFGFGVKMQLSDRFALRVDFRDNLTRFPKKIIAPNRAAGADGWLHNFAPSAGVSLLF